MSTAYQEDISSNVLRRMKEGGFDFSRFHPIEFYAIFPDEERAGRRVISWGIPECPGQCARRWRLVLELSKVMYATYDDIGDFEQDFEAVVEPWAASSKAGASSRRCVGDPCVYEKHSVTADLWVGRFRLCGGKLNLRAFRHQKGHPRGWLKGKSGRLNVGRPVQQMGPIIRTPAVKSTLTMLVIGNARIAMKRRRLGHLRTGWCGVRDYPTD
jgi:hypothetical protein